VVRHDIASSADGIGFDAEIAKHLAEPIESGQLAACSRKEAVISGAAL
jgi:hypothetical protein